MKEFYYNKKLLRKWAIISLLMLLAVLCVSAKCLELLIWVSIVKFLALSFCLSMFYVYMNPQRLAKIDDEGITIDHNEKLKWSDIEKKERLKSSCFCGREFIRFKLKKNAKYKLRFAQKMSAGSIYGAFSIPLYAMTKEDAALIEKEIDKHLTVGSKIKNAVKSVFKVSKKEPAKKAPKAKRKK